MAVRKAIDMTDDNPPHAKTLAGMPSPLPAPGTAAFEQLEAIARMAIANAMRPLLAAWDQRSVDMLDTLREASDARHEVRRAVHTIKVASWLVVLVMLAGVALVVAVLAAERDDRRRFRDFEQARREEVAETVIRRTEAACRRVPQN